MTLSFNEGGVPNDAGSTTFDATQTGQEAGQENGFSIPDEYAQKEWVKNFEGQTGDDLKANIFKTLDEKYSSAPVIPQSNEEYELNSVLETNELAQSLCLEEDALNAFGTTFRDIGITKEQGQKLLNAYINYGVSEFHKYTDADELENSVNTMFNGNTKQRNTVEGLIKECLSPEEREIIDRTVPNAVVEMFYKVAKGVVDKYGYKEGTQNSNSTNASYMRKTEEDKNAEYNRIVGKLEELSKRPHSPQEKADLLKQLTSIYQ